jgi:hypothetical protein
MGTITTTTTTIIAELLKNPQAMYNQTTTITGE